ncbi:MAG TPA: hypothetical protein VIK04_14910, partial [Solirubrobacteraceae bacterium]
LLSNPHAKSTLGLGLVWATSIDVLPVDRIVARGDGYLTVRSPSNPTHYWGNLLIFDRPPRAGDRPRWEALFEQEFADQPASVHRTFGWDLGDDVRGAADEEFAPFGYDVELSTGLIAAPDQIRTHPRASRDVEVRALDPRVGSADEPLWDEVREVWASGRDERFNEETHRRFPASRLTDLRRLFTAGQGAWYVALSAAGRAAGLRVTASRSSAPGACLRGSRAAGSRNGSRRRCRRRCSGH